MIGNLKRCTLVCTIVAAFSMAGALDSSSQRYAVLSAVSSQVFVVCEQLEREMIAVGLVPLRTVDTLPLQQSVIFEKRN